MANPFDQFDEDGDVAVMDAPKGNPFDQFDEPIDSVQQEEPAQPLPETAWNAIKQGFVDIAAKPLQAVGNVQRNVDELLGFKAPFMVDMRGVGEFAGDVSQQSQAIRPIDPRNKITSTVAGAIPQAMGMIATGGTLGAPAALGLGGAMGAQQGFETADEIGVKSPLGKLATAAAFGATEAAVERLGGIGGKEVMGSAAKRFLTGLGLEAIEEPITGIGQDAITRLAATDTGNGQTATGYDLSQLSPTDPRYWEKRGLETVGGAAGGTIFAGVQALGDLGKQQQETPVQQEVQQGPDDIDAAMQEIANQQVEGQQVPEPVGTSIETGESIVPDLSAVEPPVAPPESVIPVAEEPPPVHPVVEQLVTEAEAVVPGASEVAPTTLETLNTILNETEQPVPTPSEPAVVLPAAPTAAPAQVTPSPVAGAATHREASVIDSEYAEAFARGDVARQQELIDEAAKAAGRRELYHGSSTPYTGEKVFENRSTSSGADAMGIYMSPDVETSAGYGQTDRYWVEADLPGFDEFNAGLSLEDIAAGRTTPVQGDGSNAVWRNHNGTIEIVVRNAEQIGSAAPVVFDKTGKPVPPSKRFPRKEASTPPASESGQQPGNQDPKEIPPQTPEEQPSTEERPGGKQSTVEALRQAVEMVGKDELNRRADVIFNETPAEDGLTTTEVKALAMEEAARLTASDNWTEEPSKNVLTDASTPATGGGMETTTPQRDATKPEQMTPDEATERVWPPNKNTAAAPNEGTAVLNGMPATKKNGWWSYEGNLQGKEMRLPVTDGRTAARLDHQLIIRTSVDSLKPVSVDAVDWYEIKLPEGYVKQGELYVHQPEDSSQSAQDAATTKKTEPTTSFPDKSGYRKTVKFPADMSQWSSGYDWVGKNNPAGARKYSYTEVDADTAALFAERDKFLSHKNNALDKIKNEITQGNPSRPTRNLQFWIGVYDGASSRLDSIQATLDSKTNATPESPQPETPSQPAQAPAVQAAAQAGVQEARSEEAGGAEVALRKRGYSSKIKRRTGNLEPVITSEQETTGEISVPPVYSEATQRQIIFIKSNGEEESVNLGSLRGAAGFAETKGANTSLAGGIETTMPDGVDTVVVLDIQPKKGNLAGPTKALVFKRENKRLPAPSAPSRESEAGAVATTPEVAASQKTLREFRDAPIGLKYNGRMPVYLPVGGAEASRVNRSIDNAHFTAVERALKRGEKVPLKVMKDYQATLEEHSSLYTPEELSSAYQEWAQEARSKADKMQEKWDKNEPNFIWAALVQAKKKAAALESKAAKFTEQKSDETTSERSPDLASRLESEVGWKRDMHLKQADSDNGGRGLAVGAEHINDRWKAEAISDMVRFAKEGKSLAEATAEARRLARESIAKHNAQRPKDINWKRWEGSADEAIDFVARAWGGIQKNTAIAATDDNSLETDPSRNVDQADDQPPNHIGIKAWKRLTPKQKRLIIADRQNARKIISEIAKYKKARGADNQPAKQPAPTPSAPSRESEAGVVAARSEEGGEPAVAFSPDDKLLMRSPFMEQDDEVNYRGPLGDGKSVVVSPRGIQMTVDTKWLRRKGEAYTPERVGPSQKAAKERIVEPSVSEVTPPATPAGTEKPMPSTKDGLIEELIGKKPEHWEARIRWSEKHKSLSKQTKASLVDSVSMGRDLKAKGDIISAASSQIFPSLKEAAQLAGNKWRNTLIQKAKDAGFPDWVTMPDNTLGEEAARLSRRIAEKQTANGTKQPAPAPSAPSRESEAGAVATSPPGASPPVVAASKSETPKTEKATTSVKPEPPISEKPSKPPDSKTPRTIAPGDSIKFKTEGKVHDGKFLGITKDGKGYTVAFSNGSKTTVSAHQINEHNGGAVVEGTRFSMPSEKKESQTEIGKLREWFNKTGLVTVKKAKEMLGGMPEHLGAVVSFMQRQREKAVAGSFSKRDIAKAYLMTLGSIGSSAINVETFERKTGLTVPSEFKTVENGKEKIRPEEAVALWFGTATGKSVLDAIDAGDATASDISDLLRVRDAFGRNDIRNNALRIGGRGKTLSDIAEITDKVNAAKGDVGKINEAVSSLTGIGPGKLGFIKHLLGFGDSATIDAVELNFWLTGSGKTNQLESKRADLVRKIKSDGGGMSGEVATRIENQIKRLAAEYGLDENYSLHVIHHWLWDMAKGVTTTHDGMMKAMELFALPASRSSMPLDKARAHVFNKLRYSPRKVRVISEPSMEFRGRYDPTGEIVLNTAYLGSIEELNDVLHNHEAIHDAVETDEGVRKQADKLLGALTEDELTDIEADLFQYKDGGFSEADLQAERQVEAIRKLTANRPDLRSAWGRLVESVSLKLKRMFGGDVTRQQAELVAARIVARGLKRLRKGKTGGRVGGGSLYQASPSDVTRFKQLTASIPPKPTPEQLETWKQEHPAEYKELEAMRERVLREMGYDIGPAYHGTNKKFTVFKKPKFTGWNTGEADPAGSYFSYNANMADEFAMEGKTKKIYEAFLKFSNPASQEDVDAARDTVGNDSRLITKHLESKGFDSFERDPGYGHEIAVFNPSQIKSADPLATDDSGNLIPPDLWGNETSPDIRYSLPKKQPTQETNDEQLQFIRDYVDSASKADAEWVQPSVNDDTKMVVSGRNQQGFGFAYARRFYGIGPNTTTPAWVKVDWAATPQVKPYTDGRITIGLNASRVIKEMGGEMSAEAGAKFTADAIDEEMIHLADTIALRRAWIMTGKQGSFYEFLIQHSNDLLAEVEGIYNNGTKEERDAIDNAFAASRHAYTDNTDNFKQFLGHIQDFNNSRNAAEAHEFTTEFVRQIVQIRRSGEITETGWQRIKGAVSRFLQQSLDLLKQAAGLASNGAFGKILQKRIADVEAMLETINLPENDATGSIDAERGGMSVGAAKPTSSDTYVPSQDPTGRTRQRRVLAGDLNPPTGKEVLGTVNPDGSMKDVLLGDDGKPVYVATSGIYDKETAERIIEASVPLIESIGLETVADILMNPQRLLDNGIVPNSALHQGVAMEAQFQANQRYLKDPKNPANQSLYDKTHNARERVGTEGGQSQGIRGALIGNERYQSMFITEAIYDQIKKGLVRGFDTIMDAAEIATKIQEAVKRAEEAARADLDDMLTAINPDVPNDVDEPVEIETPEEMDKDEKKARSTAESIITEAANRLGDPPVETKKQSDLVRELYKKHVSNRMGKQEFEAAAVALKLNPATAYRLWNTGNTERTARETITRYKQIEAEKRKQEAADKKSRRLIYETMKRMRQSGYNEANKKQADSILKAFNDQVKKPESLAKFQARLRNLRVSNEASEALFETARKEAADREKMQVFKDRKALLEKDSPVLASLLNKLKGDISWKEILGDPKLKMRERMAGIFDRVRKHEALQDLSPAEQETLTKELERLLQKQRLKQVNKDLNAAGLNLPKKAEKVVRDSMPELLRLINTGTFSAETFRDAIAPKFGLKTLSSKEVKRVEELASQIDSTPEGTKKDALKREMIETMSDITGTPKGEIMLNVWVGSVLSGLRTQLDTLGSILNGFRKVIQGSAVAAMRGEGKLAAASYARFFEGLVQGTKEAIIHMQTGDPTMLNSWREEANAWLASGAKAGHPYKVSEKAWKAAKEKGNEWRLPFLAVPMAVGRMMTAFDHINSTATASAAIPLAISYNKKLFQDLHLPDRNDMKRAVEQAEALFGKPKTWSEKVRVQREARELVNRSISESEKIRDQIINQAKWVGQAASYVADPTGVGGLIYHSIKRASRSVKAAAEKAADEAKAGDNELKKKALNLAAFASHFGEAIVGTQFLRFGASKIQEFLNLTPGIGLVGLWEKEQNPTKRAMLMGDQAAGSLVFLAAVAATLAWALGDDDDEEERGVAIEGGWMGVDLKKQRQMLSEGKTPYSIRIKDDSGRWHSVKYSAWPIAAILSTAGGMLDKKRYRPDDWNEDSAMSHLANAAFGSVATIGDLSAMSALFENLGKPQFGNDPVTDLQSKMNKASANFVGGFVPRIFKDMDYWSEPKHNKPDTMMGAWLKEIPVVRRSSGKPMLDIFGKQVELNRLPWSRVVTSGPVEKEYQLAGALASKGIFLSPADPSQRLVGSGRNKRHMTEEEQDAFSKRAGELYRDVILRHGDKLLEMDEPDAVKFLNDKLSEAREKAVR